MRASLRGREELVERVQQALALPTKKEAQRIVEIVVAALEATLLHNLETDGFTLKLGGFGKLSVRHKPGICRKVGFTGDNDPDEGSTEGYVRQLGKPTAAGEGGFLK